jgi:cytochrome c-type biogenesis protein CcmH/NrfG
VLGKIYIQLKRLDDAVRMLEDDAHPASRSLLGTAYFKKGDLERACLIFEQLLLNEETADDARIRLAAIYARLGQPAKAAEYMMSALPG